MNHRDPFYVYLMADGQLAYVGSDTAFSMRALAKRVDWERERLIIAEDPAQAYELDTAYLLGVIQPKECNWEGETIKALAPNNY